MPYLKALDDRFRSISSLTARIHLTGQSHDLTQPFGATMLASTHTLTDVREELEVRSLSRKEWIASEVRNDPRLDQWQASHLPLERPIASIRSQGPASEVLLHQLENLAAIAVLTDRKARSHLPANDER